MEDSLGWLRRLLLAAKLAEHFEAAASWVGRTGCIQSDLESGECLQELIDHLALKKYPAKRLQDARSALAEALADDRLQDDKCSESTAASSRGKTAEADANDFACGQSVVVEYGGESFAAKVQCQNSDRTFRVIYDIDGTYEDVQKERIREEALIEVKACACGMQTAAASNTQVPTLVASKSAKKRARKQNRDASYSVATSAGVAAQTAKPHIPCQRPMTQPDQAAVAVTRAALRASAKPLAKSNSYDQYTDLLLSTWSVNKEGCKSCAQLTLPSKFVGWVIGKGGSTIKHIEQTYLVTVQIVSETVTIHGKHERVKRAMDYVNQICWEGA